MLKLSEKKIQEQQTIHQEANKAKKNPYKYEKEVKQQKYKNKTAKTQIYARAKGEI
jgi:hypothetical protein